MAVIAFSSREVFYDAQERMPQSLVEQISVDFTNLIINVPDGLEAGVNESIAAAENGDPPISEDISGLVNSIASLSADVASLSGRVDALEAGGGGGGTGGAQQFFSQIIPASTLSTRLDWVPVDGFTPITIPAGDSTQVWTVAAYILSPTAQGRAIGSRVNVNGTTVVGSQVDGGTARNGPATLAGSIATAAGPMLLQPGDVVTWDTTQNWTNGSHTLEARFLMARVS